MHVMPTIHPANANDYSLISAVKNFLPPPLCTSTDFTDKWDEMFLESGCNCLFELIAEAGSAAGDGEMQVHLRDGADIFLKKIKQSSIKHFHQTTTL